MSEYFDECTRAMRLLAENPRAVFLGQAVACEGTAMFKTLRDVPMERRIELPVFEDCQMGMATGMALAGDMPVCIFPRINFLLLAVNQLVNHLDKLPAYSDFRPRVIVRTAVGSPVPLDPGPQHLGDYTTAFRHLLQNVKVVRLTDAFQIVPAYLNAMDRNGSTLLIETMSKYN